MLVFVYGTLKKDCCNHHIIERSTEFKFPAETTTMYPMYKSSSYFPYLENQKGYGNIIQGEVYEVSDEFLIKMDIFEGVPTLYKRGKIEVQFENIVVQCICYFKAEDTLLVDIELINEWRE